MKKTRKQNQGGDFVIEAFITWEDGTTSTITARDYGELFMQIDSAPQPITSIETHLIEPKEGQQ